MEIFRQQKRFTKFCFLDTIKFSSPFLFHTLEGSLRDITEVSIQRLYIDGNSINEFISYKGATPNHLTKEESEMLVCAMIVENHFTNFMAKNQIACFSKRFDNFHLWGEGKKICIEYNVDFTEQLKERIHHNFMVWGVVYYHEFEEIPKVRYSLDKLNGGLSNMLNHLYFLKGKRFIKEDEIRLVYPNQQLDSLPREHLLELLNLHLEYKYGNEPECSLELGKALRDLSRFEVVDKKFIKKVYLAEDLKPHDSSEIIDLLKGLNIPYQTIVKSKSY